MIASILLATFGQAPDAGPRRPYWQQEVAYEISARLDEPSGVLSGRERIRYANRSPDTLTTFSLHLHLNAFRPGSRWAAADSAEGRRRFNDLHDPHFAFSHVRDVTIMGEPAAPIYPFAPDSTVVRLALPRPLAPGDSMIVEMDWDARPSTVPRRQGRAGRRFDFAQWYPQVVVYDRYGWQEHPLYPAGEFYGEFARYLVDLDVAADQVVGATGVPVCGDPGWERANRHRSRAVEYRRDHYGPRTPPADACAVAAPGRKRIRWYAEDVHHFAMSLNPAYRYEGGRFEDVAIHVLYQPGDEATWGGGVAVKRTEVALAWLDQLFGRFAWPQITNVHRIEGGGTEFPMMMMNGSADQSLILHEAGHNYTQGILANNEWREGWLDEGFTSFQAAWFWDVAGRVGLYESKAAHVLQLDIDGHSEPPSLVAEQYRDFASYNTAIYNRGELFFHQLRYVVGDEAMHRILRTFYDRWKLKHVDELAFREVAEEVSGQDLSTLFGQWLHSTVLYDYGIGKVDRERRDTGWVTRVEIVRHAPGRIPVEVAIVADRDTAVGRVNGAAEREWIELATASAPRTVLLDPRLRTHDWNMLNNRRPVGFRWPSSLVPQPGTDFYLHPYFATRSRRDRLTVGIHPTLWYNDAGGVTLGLRSRDDYLGRFEQNVALVSRSTGWGADEGVEDTDFLLRARNPVFLYAPNLAQTFEAFRIEGRYGATAAIERSRREHLTFGPTRTRSAALQWVATDKLRYLDPGYYDSADVVELRVGEAVATDGGAWRLALRTGIGGGLVYDRADTALDRFFFRGTVEGTARRPLGRRWTIAARSFLGYSGAEGAVAKQRQMYFQGADPFEQLYNPFLRSRGALLVGDDMHYQMPGGGGVRGIDPRVSADGVVSLNLEVERTIASRPAARLLNRVSLAAFTDLAHPIGRSTDVLPDDEVGVIMDAGVGLRMQHRIGDTEFVTRFDLPLYVSEPALAQDRGPGEDELGFRWTFSFAPGI